MDTNLSSSARHFASYGFGCIFSRLTMESIVENAKLRLWEMRTEGATFRVYIKLPNNCIEGPHRLSVNYFRTMEEILQSGLKAPNVPQNVYQISKEGKPIRLENERETKAEEEYLLASRGLSMDPSLFFSGSETMASSTTLFNHRTKIGVR